MISETSDFGTSGILTRAREALWGIGALGDMGSPVNGRGLVEMVWGVNARSTSKKAKKQSGNKIGARKIKNAAEKKMFAPDHAAVTKGQRQEQFSEAFLRRNARRLRAEGWASVAERACLFALGSIFHFRKFGWQTS